MGRRGRGVGRRPVQVSRSVLGGREAGIPPRDQAGRRRRENPAAYLRPEKWERTRCGESLTYL